MSSANGQKSYLFLDVRHIRCGDLEYVSRQGEPIPIYPDTPQTEAIARTGLVPHGVRLVAQKATKTSYGADQVFFSWVYPQVVKS